MKTPTSYLNSFWKKLPTQQQVTGSLLIGGAIACLALRLSCNSSAYDFPFTLLAFLGVMKFREEENTPPPTNRWR